MMPNFNDLIASLRSDADEATWNIGYLKAIIGNPDFSNKAAGSYSGFAIEIGKDAVKRCVALYCSRAWDETRKTISIPHVVPLLDEPSDLLARRTSRFPASSRHRDIARVTKLRTTFLADFQQASSDAILAPLEVFRNEWLAHLVVGSRSREKIEKSGPVDDLKLGGLVKFAEQTVLLVGDLGYLWDVTENPYPERIERNERYCREFWRVLPILRDVENI